MGHFVIGLERLFSIALIILSNLILQGSRLAAKHWGTCFVVRGQGWTGTAWFSPYLFYYYLERDVQLSHSYISTNWGEPPLPPLQSIVKLAWLIRKIFFFFYLLKIVADKRCSKMFSWCMLRHEFRSWFKWINIFWNSTARVDSFFLSIFKVTACFKSLEPHTEF